MGDIARLDQEFIRDNLSPGGCADLLAAALFPHKDAPAYYEKLSKYIEENHLEIAGFSKEITMVDYGITSDMSQHIIPAVLLFGQPFRRNAHAHLPQEHNGVLLPLLQPSDGGLILIQPRDIAHLRQGTALQQSGAVLRRFFCLLRAAPGGLICGAVGRLWRAEAPCREPGAILSECAKMAAPSIRSHFAALDGESARTAGQKLYLERGLTGARGLEIAGFSKEITMVDYGITSDMSQFVTEIQIPVRKK